MKIISQQQVHEALNFSELIDQLLTGFSGTFNMPQRQVFPLSDEPKDHSAFALLPSWNDQVIGVKAFTYFPENPGKGYESLYSKIMLFNRQHGEPLALVDGTSVTYWRTAAVSALASRLLSRENSKTLLFCGTGNLAPYMIKAHLSVRPIETVYCWGRNDEKVSALIRQLQADNVNADLVAADCIKSACAEADIISCATGSPTPLILGDWVQPGTHCDFIGNHASDKRECDTALVARANVFVDSLKNVLNEAGEVLIPIREGVIKEDHILGELSQLCRGDAQGRTDSDSITLFKSVGMALGDLIAASLVLDKVE